MKKKNNKPLYDKTHIYYSGVRFTNGVQNILTNWKVMVTIIIYGIVSAIMLIYHEKSAGYEALRSGLTQYSIEHTVMIILSVFGAATLIYIMGAPTEAIILRTLFMRADIMNWAFEAPYLLNKKKVKNKNYYIYEFAVLSMPVQLFEDKRNELEAVLDANIVHIKQGKNKKRILVYAVPYEELVDALIQWNDKYIPEGESLLAIGENFAEQEIVDLNNTPHILIGGSTGSGKSLLLKCMLFQCIKKGFEVYIADFKGGVDFSRGWHKNACIITETDDLIETLDIIVKELQYRKGLFYSEGVKNLGEYNLKYSNNQLPRIIFACDEVAQLLDKTALEKAEKEKISKIESMLATIARLGRAFGIHEFLATQRPDSNILSGQIKNNIDYRVCGRADEVLSRIILDDTTAAKTIAKDAQGVFVTNAGTLIKGYYFEESLIDFD